MSIEITGKLNRDGSKIWYTYEWGKGPGERKAANKFTYAKPKNQIERDHNKQVLALLDTQKSQMIIDYQSTGTPYIPAHRFKNNFFDYYQEFVDNNKRDGNRHLQASLTKFSAFIGKDRLVPLEITEDLCKRFRQSLVDHLSGKSPADYFGAFKRVIKAATKDGYFRLNPAGDVKSKTNSSKKIKEFLEAPEYVKLINTPIKNLGIRDAFIFCCYTGLRWCDVLTLSWAQIKGNKLTTRIIQKKTGKPLVLTLHPIAKQIIENRWKKRQQVNGVVTFKEIAGNRLIFNLPTRNGANKAVRRWVGDATIEKDITWSCARLSFSILLQDAGADTATVALLLGHTTTRYVNETYKRHRPKNQAETIAKLPQATWYYN